MANKPTSLIPADVAAELYQLRNLVGLAAFACEARRVLEEVDQVAQIRPELGAMLSRLIPARHTWQELGHFAPCVLDDVRQRMDVMLSDV